VVQIAEHSDTRQLFALKFFLSRTAFEHERRLYEDPDQPLGRFLPELHFIADGGDFKDRYGNTMPPCIVMEKGEALDMWATRSSGAVDMVTGLQVLPLSPDLSDLRV
jgi:hypothetical protein